MNEIVNKFLLVGEMYAWNAFKTASAFTFTCGACGPFTKNKERIQKLKETGVLKYLSKKN